jgi:hypothetical protein
MFELLSSRPIEVEFGGQKLKLGEAVEKFDQETDITREDLEALQHQIDTLKAGGEALKPPEDAPEVAPLPEKETVDDHDALERMKQMLRDSNFTWRSIKRLAVEAGVEEGAAHRMLARDKRDIKLGLGKSGRPIARIKND